MLYSETGSKPTRTEAGQMKTRTTIPNVTIGLDLGDRFSPFHVLDDQRVCLEPSQISSGLADDAKAYSQPLSSKSLRRRATGSPTTL